MKDLFAFLLSISLLQAGAQTVSGLYTGTVYNDTTKITQSYEVALSEYKGKITGYAYTTFVLNDTFYYGIRRVRAFKRGGQLLIEDLEMLSHNSPVPPNKGVRRLTVIPINGQDTLRQMKGSWTTNRTKQYIPVTGSMALRRDSDSSRSALMSHLTELKIIGPDAGNFVVKTKVKEDKQKIKIEPKKTIPPPIIVRAELPASHRTIRTLETVILTGDSLQLSLYDNGVVDGDTVSVFFNGQEIISRVRLTERAEKKMVAMPAGLDETEIVLVANNLGSLPPNTGLLVIHDGKMRYPVYFTADLQNNARIMIRRKRP